MALCVLRTAPVHWPVVRTRAWGSETYTTYPIVIKRVYNLNILITITIAFTFTHFSWLHALGSFVSRNIRVVFKNAVWPPKPDVFYECLTRSLKAMSIYSVIWHFFQFRHFFATLTGNDASNWLNIIKFVISRSISVEIDTSLAYYLKFYFRRPFWTFF